MPIPIRFTEVPPFKSTQIDGSSYITGGLRPPDARLRSLAAPPTPTVKNHMGRVYTLPGGWPMARALLAASLIASASMVGSGAQNAPAGDAGGRTNTIYVTAVEDTGAPVLDLGPADFAIKEDGKNRDVLRAEVAKGPMQVAVL